MLFHTGLLQLFQPHLLILDILYFSTMLKSLLLPNLNVIDFKKNQFLSLLII